MDFLVVLQGWHQKFLKPENERKPLHLNPNKTNQDLMIMIALNLPIIKTDTGICFQTPCGLREYLTLPPRGDESIFDT
jgi:hypothetical protein